MLNSIARYKWHAWVGLKGRSSEQAMPKYIAEIERVAAEYGQT